MLGAGERPRRWVPALAAASVAVIAAAALTVLPDGSRKPAAEPATAAPTTAAQTPQSFAQGNQGASNDDLLIRPGDRVQVDGSVIVAPGKGPVYCPDLPQPAIGYPPGQEPAPSCPAEYSVALKGLNLDRISHRSTRKGVVTGGAKVIGIWGADRSIQVQEQTASEPRDLAPEPLPPIPCPAPAGGWKSKPSNINSATVTAFLTAHADQVSGPIFRYPNGYSRGAPVVIVIGVAHGEPAALQHELEKVYSGNLCVAKAVVSRADEERMSQAMVKATDRTNLGIYAGGGSGMELGRSTVQLLAYTEQVKAALTPVGLDLLQVIPAVTPVR
jgi:hypothetical protein